ncbi:hypothetical protein B296_00006136 [Ensete ventricosum]|uniref:Uncharacterized protein n=1 Tax=Ensete ventricosum TaxID=4639 RepID=A0A427ASI9_ENSVE|nr:hypothetical protein B296_00006136 [Ensete ventricosum]
MVVEGQRDAKNTTLIPSIRTLADSKFRGDHYRGLASLELYRGSLLQIAAQRLQKILFLLMIKLEDYKAMYKPSNLNS